MAESTSKSKIPDDLLRVNIKTLRISGLWNYFGPEQKSNLMYSMLYVSSTTVLALFIISLLSEIIFNWGDLDIFTVNMSAILTYGACWCKNIGHISASKRIHRLVHKLRGGKLSPPEIWSKEQFTIARNYDRYVRIISWTYYMIGVGTLGSKVASSFIENSETAEENSNSTDITPKTLPFPGYFPYDYQKRGYYELSFLLHICMATIAPAQNIGWDALYIGLIMHSCCHFKILKNSLQNIKRRAIQMLQEENLLNKCNNWKPDTKSSNETINSVGNKPTIKECVGDLQRYSDEGSESEYCCEDHLRIKLSVCLRDCIKHHQQILE